MRTLLQLSLEMKTLSNKTKITGGNWKGRSIDIIDKSNVKPTKSYIRENLFNWIGHNLSNKWIVDAFAGSGSLGFEAASRKASKVIMLESDKEVYNFLVKQKEKLNANNIEIYNEYAQVFLKNYNLDSSIVFLDPPFLTNDIYEIIEILSKTNDIVVYFEIPLKIKDQVLKAKPNGWDLTKHSKIGNVFYGLFSSN